MSVMATGRGTIADSDSDPPTSVIRGRDDCIELPPGSIVDEMYEIDAKLGAGAMGEVYAARHLKLDKRVAIKVIGQSLSDDDAAIERFAQEAKTLAKIQHPTIVAVDHVGELADGRAYFVMEFLLGETLFARLSRGPLPVDEALRILDQMARGLDAAHAQGVTHRDVKPENTFLVHLPGEAPAVKLVDYGLAKLRSDRTNLDSRAKQTQTGVAIGTPMYMSPEQMRGPDVDHRTDIYALGCVAYEMLLGHPPFEHARTIPELFAAHLHETPPLPRSIWPEVPPELDLVLFAMIAKNPESRPTLAQIRTVIATVANSRASRLRHMAASTMLAPRSSRAVAIVLAGAAMIVGIVIGISAMRPASRQSGALNGRTDPADADAEVGRDATPAIATDATTDVASPTHPLVDDAMPVAMPRDAGVARLATSKVRGVVKIVEPAAQPGVDAGGATSPVPVSLVMDAPQKEPQTIDAPEHPTATDSPASTTSIHRPMPAPSLPKLQNPARLGRDRTVNPFATKRTTR